MDYSIYKDNNVSSTIERIYKILNSVGIELQEYRYKFPSCNNYMPGYSYFPTECKYIPYSSRVTLFNYTQTGTNGKGTSEENCKASALSEFMERIQNQILPRFPKLTSDSFYYAPDEKDYDQISEDFASKYDYTEILSTYNIKKKCLPYFNIRDKKQHYIPFLSSIFGSNGMVAGNTPEEALVQGFSEICERHSCKQIFIKNIAMPNVPKEYYEKYERIKGLVDYTEQLGWKVHIKDASLGQGLPVVCTIFENRDEQFFSYVFGAHPSLPIAIERTITEFYQGGLVNNYSLNESALYIEYNSEEDLKQKFSDLLAHKWFFKTSDKKIYDIFFNNNSKYKFSAATWIEEGKQYTNKELLKILVDIIYKITNNDIYIRDVSFLKFPAYHIFIPEISQVSYYNNEMLNMYKWLKYFEKYKEEQNYNIDTLISAILYIFSNEFCHCEIAPSVSNEYLILLCYIVKDDIENILKYTDRIKKLINSDSPDEYLELINVIQRYYELKQQNTNNSQIEKILNKEFGKDKIKEFKNFLSSLDFDYIKNLILKFQQEDKDKQNKAMQKEEPSRIKFDELKQILIQKYIENTPNQMNLSQVFDFSDINN